jgi:predicted transcriptional regulator
MKEKLFDSEAKVMEILWREGPLPAKEISLIAADSIGWNKNTTYTVIKKLEAKGFIRRDEPGFVCTPLISEKDIRKNETSSLLTRFFGGSRKALFSALIEDEELSDSEVEELKNLIDKRLGAKEDKKKDRK